MSVFQRAALSVVCGVVITAALTLAAFSVENDNVSRALMWQASILVHLVGPGPVIGHDQQGNPLHEGTPVHMLAGVVGILLGIPIYSLLTYVALRPFARRGSASPGRTANDG